MAMVKYTFFKVCIFVAIQSIGLYGSVLPNTIFVKVINAIKEIAYSKKDNS